jgi:type II secretory pathway predicted ATPase ExeA
MHVNGSSLGSKAFGEHADPRLIVAYQSHQDGLRFLSEALGQHGGVALIQGPGGSGKTTIVTEQAGWLSRDSSVAIVDGKQLSPQRMLTGMLSQFGIEADTENDEQLMELVDDFLTGQPYPNPAPVLIVDNVDLAPSSSLRLLNWLAALEVRDRYALRIVLTGQERIASLVRLDGMHSLARRNPATYSLNPLSAREAMIYLRTRLIAAGSDDSETVFPIDVTDRLCRLSRGWPGVLNGLALELIVRMQETETRESAPRAIVTRDGETLQELALTKRQYIIGRSRLADILIEDMYVSKLHALLQVYSNALVLLDLNSTNGTTVNSAAAPKTVLKNNDVISLGRHRIKVENVPVIDATMDELVKASDTLTIRNLSEIRRQRARRTLAVLKHHGTSS